jgi:hypothetical protein
LPSNPKNLEEGVYQNYSFRMTDDYTVGGYVVVEKGENAEQRAQQLLDEEYNVQREQQPEPVGDAAEGRIEEGSSRVRGRGERRGGGAQERR